MRSAAVLRAIAIFKLVKAVILVASLATVFDLVHHDPAHTLIRWALRLHVDPDSRYLRALLARLLGLDERHLVLLALGTVFYAVLFCVEGVGLLLERPWAEYLTIVATASLVPIEIYETATRPSPIKPVLLVLNLAIVVYLAMRVRRDRLERSSRT